MANSANWFETKRKAYKQRTVVLTTSATNVTYTAKTGRATDNFIIDAVIQVVTTSGNDMAITLPDGTHAGQTCLIECTTNAGATDTIDVATSTGDDSTQITGVSGWSLLLWIDDTNGWVEQNGSAT